MLGVRVVETGCRCQVLVLGAVSWLFAWWKQGAGAGCVVETEYRCWVPMLGAGAGCARGGERVLGKLANCGAADFWSQHGCAPSQSKAVDVVDGALREHLYALVLEDYVYNYIYNCRA